MSVIEMEMKEHAIYKICKEYDSEKYLAIASQSSGYAKLCCYAVKKLNENEIVSSYENICVALWLMFPKYEKFHLKGFDDMPDTDYMEKIIKLPTLKSGTEIMNLISLVVSIVEIVKLVATRKSLTN